ncbi:uncharacterized protein LOC122835438 [Gambusia affinis]|uniref:uncharacterized protein LOC122835438 n=1 Tax=Gambusia affinis TaxID=33528 RepID=UPI001CDBF6A8|nr:uncharacterized protein LOC122835438 [Gambusia affinis]
MSGSAGAQATRGGPVFFFDQPTRQNRIKGNILNFMIRSAGPQPEDAPLSQQEEGQKGESNSFSNQNPSGIACEDEKRDPSSSSSSVSAAPKDQMDAYRRAAPHLLNDLAHLLSQHKWSEEDRIPRGIVNILDYSWHDLTAGAALRLRRPAAMTENQRRPKESPETQKTPRRGSDGAKEETGERTSDVERNAGSFLTKDKANQSERKKKRSSKGAVRISISVWSCEDAGGIAQPEQHRCDEPEIMRVNRWVAERLRAARNPQNLPPPEQDPSTAPILRHYGDGRGELTNDRRRRRTAVAPLVDVLPQIPEVKLPNPVQRKLHYRINDGSSFIYYPSGCMAVCQSRSGLPHGGFYTNVFGDGQRPTVLLTITAFGRGTVTDTVSSTISAVWDQDGGFRFDDYGNTTEEWSWPTYRPLRRNITMQVSEEISVKLCSGKSGVLSFRCEEESVHLPLRFVTNKSQRKKMPCLQTENKFSSGAAQELRLLKKQKSPAGVSESKMGLRKTPVVREEEKRVKPSALWRRRRNAMLELQRLQQRVRDAAEGWLDYYRVAIGIKCPDAERLPGARPRARPRRAPQSAALPSPKSPERAAAARRRSGRGRRDELTESYGRRSASAEKHQDRLVQMQRRPKESRKEPPVTQIGPLRIHGNVEPGSVTLSCSLEPDTALASCGPANGGPAAPSVPLATCPALLRAALRGEERRRRCCCSATLMPVVTDLEYDAFVMGQPLDSKQMLVMCVTTPQQPLNTHTAGRWADVEDLYRRRNAQRTMPCTQCQTDSFRLVRYEMSDGMAGRGPENVLLQQRHGAAPGMFLMYLKGKLLFLGYIGRGDSCSAVDLQREICRTRRDSRLGLSLPADHKFSDVVKTPAAKEA